MARDLDLTETALRDWVRQAQTDAGEGLAGAITSSEKEELARLRRENRVLRMERDIQKSRGLLREVEHVRFTWIDAERASWPVTVLAAHPDRTVTSRRIPLPPPCPIITLSRSSTSVGSSSERRAPASDAFSAGGIPIIAIPSTAVKGTVSHITPALRTGAGGVATRGLAKWGGAPNMAP